MLCRNCKSTNVVTISNQGMIAPFFFKRVHNFYVVSLEERVTYYIENTESNIKKISGKLFLWVFEKFSAGKIILQFRSPVVTDIRVCQDCSFIGPEVDYSYKKLSALYLDYRSNTYNLERSLFEPSYEKIKHCVGKSEIEILVRLKNLDAIVERYIDIAKMINIADWGGGEGKFIPTSLQEKQVWIIDISNESLTNNKYHRIEDPKEKDAQFDYVQVCHVLEHVSSPYKFMLEVLEHVNHGGYVYIELPQDKSDKEIQEFVSLNLDVCHVISEHLNLFNTQSLEGLAIALDLHVIHISSEFMDFGDREGNIVSGLFIKK